MRNLHALPIQPRPKSRPRNDNRVGALGLNLLCQFDGSRHNIPVDNLTDEAPLARLLGRQYAARQRQFARTLQANNQCKPRQQASDGDDAARRLWQRKNSVFVRDNYVGVSGRLEPAA